jgi:putative oxidoreductase
MTDRFQNGFALLARVLLAALFLPAGISKIAGFAGTAAYIGSVGLPLPELGAAIAVLVEVGGGLALLAGYQTRLVALLMAIFTVVAGVFFHAFWTVAPEQLMLQQIMFMKNIAIAGGLLALTAFGAGALSLDARRPE